MDKVWHIRPNIYIRRYESDIDAWYAWTYTVGHWDNTETKYEGYSDSKEELWQDIGKVVGQRIMEEGSTYGL